MNEYRVIAKAVRNETLLGYCVLELFTEKIRTIPANQIAQYPATIYGIDKKTGELLGCPRDMFPVYDVDKQMCKPGQYRKIVCYGISFETTDAQGRSGTVKLYMLINNMRIRWYSAEEIIAERKKHTDTPFANIAITDDIIREQSAENPVPVLEDIGESPFLWYVVNTYCQQKGLKPKKNGATAEQTQSTPAGTPVKSPEKVWGTTPWSIQCNNRHLVKLVRRFCRGKGVGNTVGNMTIKNTFILYNECLKDFKNPYIDRLFACLQKSGVFEHTVVDAKTLENMTAEEIYAYKSVFYKCISFWKAVTICLKATGTEASIFDALVSKYRLTDISYDYFAVNATTDCVRILKEAGMLSDKAVLAYVMPQGLHELRRMIQYKRAKDDVPHRYRIKSLTETLPLGSPDRCAVVEHVNTYFPDKAATKEVLLTEYPQLFTVASTHKNNEVLTGALDQYIYPFLYDLPTAFILKPDEDIQTNLDFWKSRSAFEYMGYTFGPAQPGYVSLAEASAFGEFAALLAPYITCYGDFFYANQILKQLVGFSTYRYQSIVALCTFISVFNKPLVFALIKIISEMPNMHSKYDIEPKSLEKQIHIDYWTTSTPVEIRRDIDILVKHLKLVYKNADKAADLFREDLLAYYVSGGIQEEFGPVLFGGMYHSSTEKATMALSAEMQKTLRRLYMGYCYNGVNPDEYESLLMSSRPTEYSVPSYGVDGYAHLKPLVDIRVYS